MKLITLLYSHYHTVEEFRNLFKGEFKTSYEFVSDDDRYVNEIAITFGKNKAIVRYGLPRSEKADIIHLSNAITAEKIMEVIRDFDYPPRAFNIHFSYAPAFVKALLKKRNKPVRGKHSFIIAVPTIEHFARIAIIRVDMRDYSCEPDDEYLEAFCKEFPLLKTEVVK